jgi:hypothetical protein
MPYPEFRAQGLLVGSGVVEAGCKTLFGQRLKQSGMVAQVGQRHYLSEMHPYVRQLRRLLGGTNATIYVADPRRTTLRGAALQFKLKMGIDSVRFENA